MDIRNEQLAKNLVNYSCSIKEGEKILIEGHGTDSIELVNCIVKEVYKAKGYPFVSIKPDCIKRNLLLGTDETHSKLMAKYECPRMDDMDAYIGVRASSNITENADVPQSNMAINSKHYSTPLHSEIRVPNTKWVVLRYPNSAMAQFAGTSVESFEEFYYNVCTLDYAKMGRAMESLVSLMKKTDKVRVTGVDTDLTFSIKDIPVIPCDGKLNIPDGEVFTAPIKDSVNGYISYNTPALRDGFVYENIRLEFKDGKIIKATANDTDRINKIFDIDDGARYIGEFAIGVNPYILEPMKDTLFDEKIAGSFHFTPGSSYDEACNSNKSSLHWDLVCIQRPEFGGGEIYFDDVLIRKDGLFVIDELKNLNPENLK